MHRHKTSKESTPRPMNGMCPCPGCHAAFAQVVEKCSCGAERVRCCGMGRANDQTHRAHGFYLWSKPAEEATR